MNSVGWFSIIGLINFGGSFFIIYFITGNIDILQLAGFLFSVLAFIYFLLNKKFKQNACKERKADGS